MESNKDKNEPGRFLGEGVSFRAKLIGVLEVPEARGDRMCQEALADLKMAIRAAGEHKQRIQVHVAIDGLRLRDDKTGDSLYHHPVHKISFIAQDMTDSRAFGYIFGSPDTGHRFFGIKTDKAASQVVIAMRDLFQVVFELKKKEVEMAKQQLEGKTVTSSITRHTASILSDTKAKSITTSETSTSTPKTAEVGTESGVAELVDLEQELSSLRRGLTQVEGLTPSTDPFGDSFIVPSQKGLLPPPPPVGTVRGRTGVGARTTFSPTNTTSDSLPFDLAPVPIDLTPAPAPIVDNINEPPPELKNPPKKVLKDLVPTTQSVLTDILPVTKESKADYGPATTMTSLTRQSGGSVTIAKQQNNTMFTGNFFTSDPFAETDPFDNTDPFSDSFKDDPFTSVQDIPKSSVLRRDDTKNKLKEMIHHKPEPSLDTIRITVIRPLQVSLPPEPAPKTPRFQRRTGESGRVRQRPQLACKINPESASPPPPLPPKKTSDVIAVRPPPRPPHEHELDDGEQGPPLPRPARKKEPLADRSRKPRLSSGATNSSEEEYLTPAPPPLPAAKRFDITLAQLLTCTMDELANRLHVPATTLSSMTLPQLTDYLRSYLAADTDRAHIHIEPSSTKEIEKPLSPIPLTTDRPDLKMASISTEFKPQFEDNFAPGADTNGTFVANFEDFDKKANPSYDRYAAFREIQEQELKAKSILELKDNDTEIIQDSDDKEELTAIDIMNVNQERDAEVKELSRSPLKTLDELTLDSFNMFRNSVSPKPTQIDAKIEDIKSVMKNLQIDKARRSVSPRDNGKIDVRQENSNDRYAALREITITEPSQDEFESMPPDGPKERKKSDEKSDGFDNSDFFDCIDNSSLSFTHVEDAFRKSPSVKEREEDKKVEPVNEISVELMGARDAPPPGRLSAESISDVASGSSPDTKQNVGGGTGSGVVPPSGVVSRWGSVRPGAGSACSSDSRDSEPRPRRRTRHSPATRIVRPPIVQTSSSSRDVSPWDEDLSPVTRLQRPLSHHRDRESRHNSSGSREYLDSGSGREKDKIRDKHNIRDRDLSRDSRESARDRRDSGSGRDRRDLSKDRDHRESRDRRDRRSRDRENDSWDRDRNYSRERDYRDSRSRERPTKDYREKDRERHRRQRHSYDEDEEDYSDGCGSGRSSPRERWPDQRWRRDEKNYGSLGWRETRRRAEMRQAEDSEKSRYGSTLGWPARRSTNVRREGERERDIRDLPRDLRDPRDPRDTRDARDVRDARRRTRREETRARIHDYRFSNDFSPREREHTSPFDDFQESPAPVTKKRTPYSSLEGTRFAFETEEVTASPLSGSSARARDGDSPATRFRFDSDSISPRSMFEDDFTAMSTPRGRAASIAEEDEDVPPLRAKPTQPNNKDIKKSESINIFSRDSDPFEGDAFFACTGSDRVARRENWPGDFQGFDNA